MTAWFPWIRRARRVPLLALLMVGARARAQCSTAWVPMPGLCGVHGVVRAALEWDPDGPGPRPAQVVVAGDFRFAGSVAANCIAAWDPVTRVWSPLGSGLNSTAAALAQLANGDLAVGGFFTVAGGVPAPSVARWDGATWSALGGGLATPGRSSGVQALTLLPNGDLVAAGTFVSGGANRIARWDGTNWNPMGNGLFGFGGPSDTSEVNALVTLPNGHVVAGGVFLTAGSTPVSNIARWDGMAWNALGAGLGGQVFGLAVRPNGDIAAAGRFPGRVAVWQSASWSVLPAPPFLLDATALAALPNGDLVAVGGSPGPIVARWNGSTWSPLGSGAALGLRVHTLTLLQSGDLVAGGDFSSLGGVGAGNVALWNGTAWSRLSDGRNGYINSLAVLPNGEVVAGGTFTAAGSVTANRVARWNGTTWSALGSGVLGYLEQVRSVAAFQNGDIAVGGNFTTVGTVPAQSIARWNGSTWSALGSGIAGYVLGMQALPNGDLVAAGSFADAGGVAASNIARWNGTAWSALGNGTDSVVTAVLALPNGHVIAGGNFSMAGTSAANRIARWNGTAWSALGAGLNGNVYALAVLPGGDVIAGGEFTMAGSVGASGIARWNGTAWSALGAGVSLPGVSSIVVLPNGDLLVGGAFQGAGGNFADYVARWSQASATWSPIPGAPDSRVTALASLADGSVLVAGEFQRAGGVPSAVVARLTTTCPAAAQPSGSGCPSSGGNNLLAAATLPWLGATWRATATGLPLSAIVLSATSVTPIAQGALPLASLVGQGLPGCDLLVLPENLGVLAPTGGTVESALAIPDDRALVGLVLYHQLIPFEVGMAGVVAVTATNALRLTTGRF